MAMRQRANVNVSGGGSKVKYYMSLDFQHEDGLLNTEKLCYLNKQHPDLQLYVPEQHLLQVSPQPPRCQ